MVYMVKYVCLLGYKLGSSIVLLEWAAWISHEQLEDIG